MNETLAVAKKGLAEIRGRAPWGDSDSAQVDQQLVKDQALKPGGRVNLRDIGELSPELLYQGVIYRSSQFLVAQDIKDLQIKSVLDLRVIKRQCKKIADSELKAEATDLQHSTSNEVLHHRIRKDKPYSPVIRGPRCTECHLCSKSFGAKFHVSAPVYHADLMPLATGIRIYAAMPMRVKLKAMLGICKGRNPQKIMAPAVVDPDVFGMTPLYKHILDYSKSGIARALRLFANAHNYPILVHCIHGKDRTGLVILLLLLLADIPEEVVIADYVRSEYALKHSREQGDLQLEEHLTSDNHLSSDSQTVLDTLQHLHSVYHGPRGYCRTIGLEDKEIAHIRQNIMKQPHPADAMELLTHQGSTVGVAVADTFTPHKTPAYLQRCMPGSGTVKRMEAGAHDSASAEDISPQPSST